MSTPVWIVVPNARDSWSALQDGREIVAAGGAQV